MNVAAIVLPRHPEHHDALRLDDALENPRPAQIGTARQHEIDALQDLLDGLMEFGLRPGSWPSPWPALPGHRGRARDWGPRV
jgi:hypothetical protein